MEQHIRIISIIDIIFGVLAILGGIFFLIAFAVGGIGIGTSGEAGAGTAGGIMVTLGAVIGLSMAVIGALDILVGVKLKQYKPWARVGQIIIGILSLPSFPIGTAFGVYCLWALFNDEGQALFKAA